MRFPGSIDDIQAVLEVLPNPVVVKNRLHRIVLVNDAACTFLERPRAELLALNDYELFPADEVRSFHAADDLVFANGDVVEREEQVTDGTGIVRHVITRKQRVCLNGTDYLIAVVSDVTAYRAAEARSHYLTFYDTLTGLPNGALSKEHLDQAFARGPERCAILIVDLDHFQTVNDSHGFSAGDELLIQFGQRLRGVVPACDAVARLGGDAFSVLLTDVDTGADIEEICRRILVAGSEPFTLSNALVRIGVSIGVAFPQDEPVTPLEMKRRADIALHQAKADGRGRWCAYSDELDRRFRHRRSTESDLREALTTGAGIEVYYQPLVSIASGEVTGYEALARWRHPTRGMVMPDDFIPIAETSGLIVPLGEMVLRKACLDAACWDAKLRLAVNVSPIQFLHGDLVATIRQTLDDTGFDPNRLELEITEGVLIDDANGTLALLNRIRALGVKIVLDDFGSGYSSLNYLRHFPFHKVKIDRSFITDMMNNDEAVAIVEAVLSLSKTLNMEVVAEGVETTHQLDLLRVLGCTQAQGYLISRPMPIDHFFGKTADAEMCADVAA
ncbi:putative bifunctional diguanylate cyclase/phosphodiesterase [Sphingomonas montana]|uniref:putative bifunctional diguanylate cyclase/phosphodiesterase n=1 Tax=Sphingomonas montana TaxID=1843236 RepID=UPI00096CAF5A|nr:EAL domain-containing protein [Sphingomonas montana]